MAMSFSYAAFGQRCLSQVYALFHAGIHAMAGQESHIIVMCLLLDLVLSNSEMPSRSQSSILERWRVFASLRFVFCTLIVAQLLTVSDADFFTPSQGFVSKLTNECPVSKSLSQRLFLG